MPNSKKIAGYLLILLLIVIGNSMDKYHSALKTSTNTVGINTNKRIIDKKAILTVSEKTISKLKIKVRIKAGESPNFSLPSFVTNITFDFYNYNNQTDYRDFVSTVHFSLYKLRGPPQSFS